MKKILNIQKIINSCHGQSLIEVIIAMAVFSLIVSSIISLILGGSTLLTEGGRFMRAEMLTREGIEAVRSILNSSWNKGVYSKSAVTVDVDHWDFIGEDTSEQIGQFTRIIEFFPIFRDDTDEIVVSTTENAYLDVHSKRIKVSVAWETRNNQFNSVEKDTYLTNWDSREWTQSDWSGGDGQSEWQDTDEYDSDDGNIFASTSVSLSEIATSTYALEGELISSGFQILDNKEFIAIEWDEVIPENCDDCLIQLQIKTAPDSSGSPGSWTTSWSGPEGDDGDDTDYFATSTGQLLSIDHLGSTWIKYKIILTGETDATPLLQEIRINYKK